MWSGRLVPREHRPFAHRNVLATFPTGRNPLATRTLNRRTLRAPNDVTEPLNTDTDDEVSDDGEDIPAPKPKKTRIRKEPAGDMKPAKARVRKKSVKVPPVMFARWAVFDNGAKRVAVFEYCDRAGADAKLAEVRAKKPGTYYLALVKDPPATPVASV